MDLPRFAFRSYGFDPLGKSHFVIFTQWVTLNGILKMSCYIIENYYMEFLKRIIGKFKSIVICDIHGCMCIEACMH